MATTGKYNLEERLIDFSVRIIQIVEKVKNNIAGKILIAQLIKSGTSPALNYGEAQAGESRNDFIHKMSISLKELRETKVCLSIIRRGNLHPDNITVDAAILENNELISIFYKSIQTARRNSIHGKS